MIKEIFSSIQGEGLYVGYKTIFVRFEKCPLNCIYCDEMSKMNSFQSRYQISPNRFDFKECSRKEIIQNVTEIISNLVTEDTYFISFTGGEPTLYPFLLEELISYNNNELGLYTYLETNGLYPEIVKELDFDYASVDIKLSDHLQSFLKEKWEKIVQKEIETIDVLNRNDCNVFAKIVVLPTSSESEIVSIAQEISDIDSSIPLVLQPVTPNSKVQESVSIEKILELMDMCGNYLEEVVFSVQVHKFLQVP